MKKCFFIGHSDAPDSLQERLNTEVESLVRKHHVTEFIVGKSGNFDRMAVAAIQRVIQCYPEKAILASILEPYFPGDREILIPPYFEDYYYPMELVSVPKRNCAWKAGEIVLKQADHLIAYICCDGDVAAKIYRSANRMAKKGYIRILNLAGENTALMSKESGVRSEACPIPYHTR